MFFYARSTIRPSPSAVVWPTILAFVALLVGNAGCRTYMPPEACAPFANTQPIYPGQPGASPPANPLPNNGAPGNLPSTPGGDPIPSGGNAGVLRIRAQAPATATVDSTIVLRIDVSNAGRAKTGECIVRYQPPLGLSFVNSRPAPSSKEAMPLIWELGEIAPNEQKTIEAEILVERAGVFDQCPVAEMGEGATVRDCARTTAGVPSVEVKVRGPRDAAVGEEITFEILVTNRSNVVATGLALTDRYDDDLLQHAVAQASPIARDLRNLAPGETEQIGVTFTVVKPGKLCNSVELTGDGGLRVTDQLCITAVPERINRPSDTPRDDEPNAPVVPGAPRAEPRPGLNVVHRGPAAAARGEIAQFLIDVTNTGDVEFKNLSVAAGYDPVLLPERATDGHQVEQEGELTWTFSSLKPGKSIRLQVNCRCQEAATRACGRVRAVVAGGLRAQQDACVRIVEPRTELTASVNSLRNPIAVGKETTYEIRVKNTGKVTDRRIVVSFALAGPQRLVPLSTSGPDNARITAQPPYSFEPVDSLEPNETKLWRVRVRAEDTGEARIVVRVDSEGLEQPLEIEENVRLIRGN